MTSWIRIRRASLALGLLALTAGSADAGDRAVAPLVPR